MPAWMVVIIVARELAITGLWGWPAVPTSVKVATLLQASRFAIRRDSPYGIAGSPSEGSELRLLAAVDPDVKVAIGKKYRREWWAVGPFGVTPQAPDTWGW